MRKLLLALIALVSINISLSAQSDPQFSQYFNVESVYNPALVALDGRAKAMVLYRNQWMGLHGSPTTIVGAVNAPFKFGSNTHVFGIKFMNDTYGMFTDNTIEVQYAFRKAMWGGECTAGVSLGGRFVNFDGSDAFVPAKGEYHVQPSEDVVIASGSDNNGFGMDVEIGVAWHDEKRFVGIACQHLPGAKLSLSDYADMKTRQLLNLTGGWKFGFRGSTIKIEPMVLFKTDFASWQLDVTALADWKKFYMGLSYRYQDAVVILAGVRNIKKIDVGVSYDITTSKLITVSSGTIELTASYNFNLEFSKKKKYKSIRIL